MRKSKVLKELEDRLSVFRKKIEELELIQYDAENGGLDLDIYTKIQFYRSEIYHTNKKINFVNQGKSFLGDKISHYNSGGNIKK